MFAIRDLVDEWLLDRSKGGGSMRVFWRVPMTEWQSMHVWLKEYNEVEMREMDKRRLFEWLMSQQWTSEGRRM